MSRARDAKAGFAVDGTLTSAGHVPGKVEPAAEIKAETNKGTTWEDSSDFVFAFRVRKVLVDEKAREIAYNEDYNKGALLGARTETPSEALSDLIVSEQQDGRPGDEGYIEAEVTEGDTVVICGIPTTEPSEL